MLIIDLAGCSVFDPDHLGQIFRELPEHLLAAAQGLRALLERRRHLIDRGAQAAKLRAAIGQIRACGQVAAGESGGDASQPVHRLPDETPPTEHGRTEGEGGRRGKKREIAIEGPIELRDRRLP